MQKRLLFLFGTLLLTISLPACDIEYSVDHFKEYYPVIGRSITLEGLELDKPVVVWDRDECRKVTILRTRGDKYAYDDQKGIITFEGKGLDKPKVVSIANFRVIDVSWITGKLVLIHINIGHVAAVESIYDVEKDSWIYQESLEYIDHLEPSAVPDVSAPQR